MKPIKSEILPIIGHQCSLYTSFALLLFSFIQKCTEYHPYLCSYQCWNGGRRLPFLVPGTTASWRNLGPLWTIVLSCRKCGPLLTPSIHWLSCVRLPRPVFIFFAFCLRPPYRISPTSPEKTCRREDGTISAAGKGGGWGVGVASQGWLTCIFTTQGIFALCSSLIRNAAWTCVFWQSFLNSPSLYQVDGKELHRPPAHPTPPPTTTTHRKQRTSINSKLSSPFNGHCLWQISLLQL